MERPASTEYAKYYQGYIDLVPNGDILQILEKQNDQFCEFLAQVDEEKANYRYAEGKWSIKQVIAHLIDVELVFMYRALRISRKDSTPIPGFEQDDYIKNSDQSHLTLSELVEQFYHMRKASIALLRSFSPDMWQNIGTANGFPASVRAIAHVMIGHVIHHMKVIHSKYLS
ncbi:MAG: DinB family protein [Calditrichaeota bacterium]|nr:MAG: DinB family protein [Calditrichota bacterium]MBL1204893.1 DinB family protein [Calditrichota bacterium]NOG44722.1 DinB family protein [Calditrichota bacterium]